MARNTAVRVLDDLTGAPAAETVGFGLDGIDYDIDLSVANAEALRELLQRYADAGRRTGGRKNRPRLVPGAQKTAPKTPPKPATATAAPAKAAPSKAAPIKAVAAKTKAAAARPAPAKPTRTQAEPAKSLQAKKAAEPKATTRAAARKVPTVTFSAAE
ncbi:Lsr2 dimerization domain-containing protein [Amycolatopsis sp. CA-126428]|uniref:Lsr2 dimerization domain-containing protein n=1 Tax=Amycolatopsis sp. CA-126428 TaxID=2073158 RepID=UPI001E41C54E|nr:histone-like nucleoid-structuring protein Lsr2 [Amycolatopsis sp. CA-126428]